MYSKGTLAQIKRAVRDKSLEKQVELYQREIKKLLGENENLKKENRKLKIILRLKHDPSRKLTLFPGTAIIKLRV